MRHHKEPLSKKHRFLAWLREQNNKPEPPHTPLEQKTANWLKRKLNLPITATSEEILAAFIERCDGQSPRNDGSVDGGDEHYYWWSCRELGWIMVLDLRKLRFANVQRYLIDLRRLGLGGVVLVVHYYGGPALRERVISFFSKKVCATLPWDVGTTAVDLTNLHREA